MSRTILQVLRIRFAIRWLSKFSPHSLKQFPCFRQEKHPYVGAVVRKDLLEGHKQRGWHRCDFVSSKPVLLVMGGSLGAQRINEAVRSCLDSLLDTYQVVHLCGKGNVVPELSRRGYCQFEYVKDELADILAMADIVVSRAGSNAIHEFLALEKPMLLIPLSKQASRGDQILNASSFEKAGYAHVLQEEDLSGQTLQDALQVVEQNRLQMQQAMKQFSPDAPMEKIITAIEQLFMTRRKKSH